MLSWHTGRSSCAAAPACSRLSSGLLQAGCVQHPGSGPPLLTVFGFHARSLELLTCGKTAQTWLLSVTLVGRGLYLWLWAHGAVPSEASDSLQWQSPGRAPSSSALPLHVPGSHFVSGDLWELLLWQVLGQELPLCPSLAAPPPEIR